MKAGHIHLFRFAILLASAVVLAGCQTWLYPELPIATPYPTQEAVVIGITPALRPLQPALETCAAEAPGMALVMEETPASGLSFENNDFVLRLGEPEEMPRFAALLGWEEIVIVLNPENPAENVTRADLQGLFSGRRTSWGESGPVVIWTLPAGDEARSAFEAALGGGPLPGTTLLAPDPAAMLEGVAANPGAIGYLPGAWREDAANSPMTPEEMAGFLRLPVLALADQEPRGAARELLSCLQHGAGAAVIREIYPNEN